MFLVGRLSNKDFLFVVRLPMADSVPAPEPEAEAEETPAVEPPLVANEGDGLALDGGAAAEIPDATPETVASTENAAADPTNTTATQPEAAGADSEAAGDVTADGAAANTPGSLKCTHARDCAWLAGWCGARHCGKLQLLGSLLNKPSVLWGEFNPRCPVF
jgi:hypothetical protein